jgi:hypothetical protein
LFLYGLQSEEEANKKLVELYDAITESLPVSAVCFRSKHAVTIVSEYPYRHIQIILRLYKSPAEILMGFDVDACSVGYDGKQVWMTPRAHRAVAHQYNTVDMSRRSPTYEMRLAKYANRGFAVLVPGLDRSKVDPQIFEKRFDQVQGLAKLLLLERLGTAEARTQYKDTQRLAKFRPAPRDANNHVNWRSARRYSDKWNTERQEELGGADASDYSTVFLPWGKGWDANRVRKIMYSKDMMLNSEFYDKTKTYHTHPCFFGTASEILKDCCGRCPPRPETEDNDQYP